VVGIGWYNQPCSYIYTLKQEDADYLYNLFEEPEFKKFMISNLRCLKKPNYSIMKIVG
jgi:hypothetical protein